MRKNKLLLAASAGLMLALAGNVMGKDKDYKDKYKDKVHKVSAPEIDVGSGGSAIALIVTAMLLAAERSRRT